jgi:hypothetical protein
MKKLTSGVPLFVLASLICLFVPCSALAQDGGSDPCCYLTPAGSVSVEFAYGNMSLEILPAATTEVSNQMLGTSAPTAANPMEPAANIEESWMLRNGRQF